MKRTIHLHRWFQCWRTSSREKYISKANGHRIRTRFSGSVCTEHRTMGYDSGRHDLLPFLHAVLCRQIAYTISQKRDKILFERPNTPRPLMKIVLKSAWQSQHQQQVVVDFGQFRLRPISTSAHFDFGQFRLQPILFGFSHHFKCQHKKEKTAKKMKRERNKKGRDSQYSPFLCEGVGRSVEGRKAGI